MRRKLLRLTIAGLVVLTGPAGLIVNAAADPAASPEPADTASAPAVSPTAQATGSSPNDTAASDPQSSHAGAPADEPSATPRDAGAAAQVTTHGSVTSTKLAFPATGMHPAGTGDERILGIIAPTETTGFSLVGITWQATGGAGHRFEVRVRNDQTWSQWYELEPALADASGTDPIWVEQANAVEARVTGTRDATIDGLNLVLIDPAPLAGDGQAAGEAGIGARGDADPPGQPPIVSRTQWGAYAPEGCEANSPTIKAITVHHTAGSNNYSIAEAPGIVRGIQSYHEFDLGWCDIGYNFLIDKYGTIYEGKAGGIRMPVHGAHATSWNDYTVGISFMMNSDTYNPSETTMEAGARLIAWKMAGYYLDPHGRVTLAGRNVNTIFRHGDVMSTACPGANITARMGWLRDRVAQLTNSTATAIQRAWQAAGGASGSYGQLVMMEAETASGRSAGFEHAGLFQAGANTPVQAVTGIFWAAYTEVGWQDNPLGFPTSEVLEVPGGSKQIFQGGEIYFSQAAGAWSVRGGLLNLYHSLGATTSRLGFPTSHEFQVGSGYAQRFQYGYAVWTSSASWYVKGGIAERYAALGGPTGRLGLPIGPETQIQDGYQQSFQGGQIYWSPDTGARETWGAIGARYAALGGATGRLGFPADSEMAVDDGYVQRFQRGVIAWTPRLAATEVWGAIGDRYAQLGGVGGRLGFPAGPERQVGDGYVQDFAAGSIQWSPATGAAETWGAIGARYAALGGASGRLGFPTGPETTVAGGYQQQFTGGIIYWSPHSPATPVWGGILTEYLHRQGGPQGALGFPVAAEQADERGWSQQFSNGTIRWNQDGSVEVTGPAAVPVGLNKVEVFINAIAPMAQGSQARYGVPASVTMAQAILESGWGESELSRYGQAFFGVKCHSSSPSPYATGCVPKLTWEVVAGQNVYVWDYFRSYDSLTDSVLDHGHFLRNNSRYAAAFNTGSAAGFVRAIAAAGYATDPSYAAKLINLIDTYNLTRFDSGAQAGIPPVANGIGSYYAAIGGVNSSLGVAVGVEADGPTAGGRMVSFNAGMITWSNATGSRALAGPIWNAYRLSPGTRNQLGLPTGDATPIGGATVQTFQGGNVYQVGQNGRIVIGGIWHTYRAWGAHEGRLGLPTSAEQVQGSGYVQYFEHGAITWTPDGVNVQEY